MSKADRKKRKQIKSWRRIEKIECRNLERKRPDTGGGGNRGFGHRVTQIISMTIERHVRTG